jgi:hypothetical protein
MLTVASPGCNNLSETDAEDVTSDAEDVTSDTRSDASVDDGEVADDSDDVDSDDGDTAPPPPDASSPDAAPDLVDITDVDIADIESDTDLRDSDDTGPAPLPPIAINEFDCRQDWVELINLSLTDIPLDDLHLTDGRNAMPLTGLLAAASPRVFPLTAFGLSCGTEGPRLMRGATLIDEAPPGNAPNSFTMGRFPDGAGPWVVTLPTPDAPNRLPDVDPFDPAAALFGPLRPIATIDLDLPQPSYDSLWAAPYNWVPGTFTWREPGANTAESHPVALRLKGRIGSFRDLAGKSGFKLDFARFHPGGTFHGLAEMTLNNMVQDYHRINETLAYDLFRRMGVPVPRTSYVWVRVNGQDMGLYLHLETLDRRWRDRNLPPTLGIFEGQYGDDLFIGSAYRMDLDGGDDSARLALELIAEAIASAPTDGFMAHLAPFVAWEEVLAAMATEVFIGHWDGYGPTRNNYFMHLDLDGVLRLLPWGLDQTFGADLDLYGGAGLLLSGCVNDPTCRIAWEDALAEVAAIVSGPDYRGWADGLAGHLQPLMDLEPREDAGDARAGLESAWGFLDNRAIRVTEALKCARDPAGDADGDGLRCDQDCDDNDPSRYLGAPELCGDGIDQDCNGRPDDSPECPDCAEVKLLERPYTFCWRERTFDDAVALCAETGGRPIIFDSNEEVSAVLEAMQRRGFGTVWVGLTDREEENVWRWLDGTLWDGLVGGYMDGEPNDWFGSEDCTQMLDWGGARPWNDIDCGALLPTLCKQPIAIPETPAPIDPGAP